jgi:hypothetical protein
MPYQIPRRIIQTGKATNQSVRDRAAMANVRLLNPDYEYLFFDDDQVRTFIKQEFPQYVEMSGSFHFPIQQYDFFRYLAVYRLGGFYFDLDVLLASGLSPLLECGCVFPFERLSRSHFMRRNLGMDWQIGNYAFGAVAGHPFLAAVIANCVKAQKDPSWLKPMMRGTPPLSRDEYLVLNSTGPGLVSRTLAENADLASMVTVLFPDDICDVRNWYLFGEYGIHLMDSSWRSGQSFLHQKVIDYCRRWIDHRLIMESRKLGKARNHRGMPAARARSLEG